MTASVVRLAGPEDAREIWRLFLEGHRENGLFKLSYQKVEWFMARALNPNLIPPADCGPRGIIGVIGELGSLEALAFLMITSNWYSDELYIGDCFVYTDLTHREHGQNHVHTLIQWMKDQAAFTGMPLMAGVVSNKRTEAKCRLYRRMLPKIGELFYIDPTNGSNGLVVATSS